MFFTKLSGIDPCEKCINIIGGHAWRNLFMACSKLEAMAIYVVKQACGNNIMACVYTVDMVLIIGQPIYVNCFHSLYFVLLGTISYHEILKGLRLSFATVMIAFG